MSAKSGATTNQDTLRIQAGLTATQAAGMSGADLMRAAYLAKAGLNASTGGSLDGAAVMRRTTYIELGR